MNIAIVGAGIHGLCTAKALCERNHNVTVFEQHKIGNPYGSSFGRTRIVRQAYPDQFFTEILLKGHDLWHELENQTDQKLIHEVGLLFVAKQSEPEMHHELDSLENLKIPHRVIIPSEIRSVHSNMVLHSDEIAVMTSSAGWADVSAVLSALETYVTNRGVKFVNQRVTNLGALTGDFDKVILTAGAWVTKFFDLPLKVTLQTFGYINAPMQGPVWIEGFGDHMYGFPSEINASTAKIGFHTPGPETDPDNPDREAQDNALEAIKECAIRRFNIKDPVIVETGCCLYTTADNDDFKIGWVDDQLLVASPCSGHGFKFGPWMGSFLADIIEGRENLSDWPRFGF